MSREGVVVSAGGGAAGRTLLRTAAEASALAGGRFGLWRLVCGPNLPDTDRIGVCELAGGGAVVERVRADMPSFVAGASVVIGQAGYNSVAELLATRTPAVLVPYTTGGETEQMQRATRMQDHRLALVLPEPDLSASALLAAVDRAVGLRPSHGFDLHGSAATARILADAIGLDGRGPKGL